MLKLSAIQATIMGVISSLASPTFVTCGDRKFEKTAAGLVEFEEFAKTADSNQVLVAQLQFRGYSADMAELAAKVVTADAKEIAKVPEASAPEVTVTKAPRKQKKWNSPHGEVLH